jgi:hypothetical protein
VPSINSRLTSILNWSKSSANSAQQEAARLINNHSGIARLREHPVGTRRSRAVGVLPIAVPADRENGDILRTHVGAQTATELDAVDARDSNVGEDEIRIQLERLLERLMAVVGLLDEEAVTA